MMDMHQQPGETGPRASASDAAEPSSTTDAPGAGGRLAPPGLAKSRESHSRFGPICQVDAGAYRAVDRDGVLVVERADSCGALLDVEWESDEQRETWERAVLAGRSAQMLEWS